MAVAPTRGPETAVVGAPLIVIVMTSRLFGKCSPLLKCGHATLSAMTPTTRRAASTTRQWESINVIEPFPKVDVKLFMAKEAGEIVMLHPDVKPWYPAADSGTIKTTDATKPGTTLASARPSAYIKLCPEAEP